MVHGRGSVDSPAECDEFPLTGEPLGPRDKQILSAPKMNNKLCVMRLSHRQKTRREEEMEVGNIGNGRANKWEGRKERKNAEAAFVVVTRC